MCVHVRGLLLWLVWARVGCAAQLACVHLLVLGLSEAAGPLQTDGSSGQCGRR